MYALNTTVQAGHYIWCGCSDIIRFSICGSHASLNQNQNQKQKLCIPCRSLTKLDEKLEQLQFLIRLVYSDPKTLGPS